MPLSEDIITGRYRISGYQDDAVFINESIYQSSFILSADKLDTDWTVQSMSDLNEATLQPILALTPDVVLLGTGRRQLFPNAAIFAHFGQLGIGLEVMDNGALCRTFNILVAEDRSVVAAVILGG